MNLPLTLAFDWQEILPAIVMLLIVTVSWVVNKINEWGKQADLQRQRKATDTARRPEAGETAESRPRYGSEVDEPGAIEPDNLTLAERIERARARARYRERAEQLGQQPERPDQSRKPVEVASRLPGGPRPGTIQRGNSTKQPLGPRAPEMPSAEAARSVAMATRRRQVEKSQLRPQQRGLGKMAVTGPVLAASPVVRQGFGLQRLGVADLRRAVVLKEILDRPLALRDPFER